MLTNSGRTRTYYVVAAEWLDGSRRLWHPGQREGDRPFLTDDTNDPYVLGWTERNARELHGMVARRTAQLGGAAAIYEVEHRADGHRTYSRV